jgi:hypothetical protein
MNPCQMIWEDKMIPFEKDRTDEDESEIDGIYDEICIDEILETTEIMIPLMSWESKMIPLEKDKTRDQNKNNETDMTTPFEESRILVATYNFFPLNPWMILWRLNHRILIDGSENDGI